MNPWSAFKFTRCDECDGEMEEGEDIFFHEGIKICTSCAEEQDLICDCGAYKKPDYDSCYGCYQDSQKEEE